MQKISSITITFRQHAFAAFLVAAAIIVWQAYGKTPDAHSGDSYAYMSIAKDLADTGIFTDGHFRQSAVVHGPQDQGMFFAPLYPALVALTMILDPTFYDTVSCHMAPEKSATSPCPNDFGAFRYVQITLAILSAFLIWLSGWGVTGRYTPAWLALVLGLSTGVYAAHTADIMTESLMFPLYTASCLSAAAAWKHKKAALWLLAGIFLGLTALTRPSFSYLFYAAFPAILVLSATSKTLPFRQTMKWPLLFLAGYFLSIGPWVLRNGLTMGEYNISKGYASFILVQRVAYNDMSEREWLASFVYGLPDFGDSLAASLFPPEDYERFDYDNPDGFYRIGNGVLREETLESAGSPERHLSYLLKHNVMNNIGQHLAVTLSLAWRGMWVCKYWGLIAIPLFFAVFAYAVRRRWGEFLIFSIPSWFMLGFHAFTSVNVVRYNLILIPCLAVASAVLLSFAISSIQEKVCNLRQSGQLKWDSP